MSENNKQVVVSATIEALSGGMKDLPEVGSTIWDPSAKEQVIVTEQGQALFSEIHNQIHYSIATQADALFKMRSFRLFLQGGYKSFNEYVEICWDFGPSKGNLYAHIGEKRAMMLHAAEDTGQDGSQVKLLLNRINQTGWRGLIGLLSDDELKSLAAGQEYTATDGKSYTLEQIIEQPTRDLRATLTSVRSQLGEKKEQVKTLVAEVEDLKLRLESSTDEQVAALTIDIRKKERRIEQLLQMTEREKNARDQIKLAESELMKRVQVLRNYVPKDDEDYAANADVMMEAAGVALRVIGALQRISGQITRAADEIGVVKEN